MLALGLKALALAVLHVELPALILRVQLLLGQDLKQLIMPRKAKADLHRWPVLIGLDRGPSQPMSTQMSAAGQAFGIFRDRLSPAVGHLREPKVGSSRLKSS